MPELGLPIGALQTDRDSPVRAGLRCGRGDRRALRDWFDRLGGLGLPGLLLPSTVADSPEGLALDYSTGSRGGVALEARVAEWGQDPAASIPDVLGLARFTLALAEGLARHKVEGLTVAPGLIQSRPDDPDSWRLIAVPAGPATLADWSTSGAPAWAWASGEALLSGRAADPAYALGAALHHGLVGAMFPELLTDREKFARLLRGRVGMPARLEATLRAASPVGCRPDLESLGRLVLDCLAASPGRRPNEAEARFRFEAIEARLGADRLARAWEAEDRQPIADEIRRRDARRRRGPEPPEAEPVPGQEWIDLAREHLARGDTSAALASAWSAMVAEGPHKADLFLMVVQRAAAVPRARAEVGAALDRLVRGYPAPVIGEANLLRLAHIRMRYFAAVEAEVAPLLGASRAEWARGLGLLLRAVFAVRKAGAHAETSRLCGEGSKVFAAMPQEGGTAGRYARAYLGLLDGVAHVGFVAAGGSPDYYMDALDRFGIALRLASDVGSAELAGAACRWLGWLSWLAGLTPGRSASTIRTAAEALLRLHGQPGPGPGAAEVPEVVAYDESYLFPA